MQLKKRLFHVEHWGIMRDIVRKFLENNNEIILAQCQCNSDELLQQLNEQDIDILILGNADPYGDSFNYPELCKTVRLQFPDIKIIVHSIFAKSSTILETMNAGAHGFVTNDMGFDDIIVAINAIKKNERYISKQISSFFQNAFEFLAGLADRLEPKRGVFTKRELEILNYIAKGRTNKQIAESLHISPKTVESHRKHLVTKAKVKNTAELIAYSGNYGLLLF